MLPLSTKGLVGTLFVNRAGKRQVAQFFRFKLKQHQLNWYACELEALAIATSVNNLLHTSVNLSIL